MWVDGAGDDAGGACAGDEAKGVGASDDTDRAALMELMSAMRPKVPAWACASDVGEVGDA